MPGILGPVESPLRTAEIVTRTETLLPDPEPREVFATVISVDDHLVEPPDMFEGRLPARYADLAPRVVETPGATSLGVRRPEVLAGGHERVAGRRPEA